jgi:acetyl-CoA C-acetyltransferase
LEKVGIVGYYQVQPKLDAMMSPYEMIYTAVKGALNSANLKRKDITTVVSATNDYYDGKTISNTFKVEAGGAYMKDESKVEMDGAYAALYGLYRILSGNHKLAMIYGFSMPSCFPYEIARVLETDPTFDRQINLLNPYTAGGLQMKSYMKTYGISEEDIGRIAVQNIKNLSRNPLALPEAQKADISVQEILNSEILSAPLRKLMYPMLCDGATALILAPERQSLKITENPVWVTGIGQCQETYYLGDRDLSVSVSMEKAAEKAYKLAGINDPQKEIDIAEIFGHTTCEEMILAEASGLCEKGKSVSLINEGPVLNPSGGAMSSFTPCACGLTRIVEAARQIRGEAEGHQISNVKKAIASGQVGFCAQNNIIFVLEGGEN